MKGTLLRFVVYTLAVAAVVVSGGAIAVYTISRNEVHTAQQMMNDVARLEIAKSGLTDVLAFAHKYRGSWGPNPCLESDCLVTAVPDSNDFWVRHPKLGYMARHVSRRSWQFVVWMWVKDGKLTAIEQWFGYYVPHSSSFVITTLSEPGRRFACQNRSYRLHHAFAVNPAPHHFNVWVNPTAGQEREMLLTAWREYEADQPLIEVNESKWQAEIAADPECR